MRIALLGLGLIGGSIARALAVAGGWHVVAWNRSPEAPRHALADGIVSGIAARPEAALTGAELVVLAAPPLANLALVRLLGPAIAAAGATLTDVSSTKVAIAARAADVPGLRFVGGHPMSGREQRGYAASDATLFRGRPWVVVPGGSAATMDVERVRALAVACGAVPVEMDAPSHDRATAAISHLPLVVSAALAASVTSADDWTEAAELAAQGWRDGTRLARGDPALGAGILATNAGPVAERLRAYRGELERWQADLDSLAGTGAAGEAAPGVAEAAAADLTERLARIAAVLEAAPSKP